MPGVGADHPVGGQRHLDFLGLEPLVEELRGALREDLNQRHQIARAQAAHLPGELQVIDEIDGAWRERRRCGQQQAFHHLRETLQLIFVRRVDIGVVRREFGDFGQRLRAVLPHEEMAPVGKRGEEGGILGVHLVAVARQFQLPDDAFLEQAGEVRGSGDAIARPDFFGDRAPAHEFAPLQHQHLAPAARQIGGGNQSVMAAADDDGIVFGHRTTHSATDEHR